MSGPRPFRFGVLCLSPVATLRDWKELSRKAEDLGYDVLLVTDHLDGPEWAPVPALAVVAEVTRHVRLGCHVFNNDLRHPAVLARDLATLDLISGGRLEVGLGAGWKLQDYTFRGMQPDAARIRIERLGEAARAVKALLAGERLTWAGNHYRFEDFALSPAAVQRPRPPLMIGGGGRRILELAAREADIVGINLVLGARPVPEALRATTVEATARKLAYVRDAAGDRFEELEIAIVIYAAIVPGAGESDAGAVAASFGMTTADLAASPHAFIGPLDSVVEQVEQQRADLGTSYLCIPDGFIDDFAPVVAKLAGA